MNIKKNIAISETGFVFNPSTGDSFSLNALGLEILQMMRAGKNQDEIFTFITDKYDVEMNVFEPYYLDFISMLKHHHILESDDKEKDHAADFGTE